MDGEFPEDSPSDGSFISNGFSGKLTIGSSDTMIVADNLIYEHARPNYSIPTELDSCPDMLGLVSEEYVMVGRSAGDTVYINAAIAALSGAFSVQDIYCTDSLRWDNERDGLYVWGSIAQKYQGLIHTHEPYYHLRGFVQKDYHYDQRLYFNTPPHFPLVQRGYSPIVEEIASGVDDRCGINADGTGILFP